MIEVTWRLPVSHDGMFHSSSALSQDHIKDETLRDDLKFYLMNPCEKYEARRHIPWKLAVQILKIVMITTQVCDRPTKLFLGLRSDLKHVAQSNDGSGVWKPHPCDPAVSEGICRVFFYVAREHHFQCSNNRRIETKNVTYGPEPLCWFFYGNLPFLR